MLHSQKVERHVLSGTIKNPKCFADIDVLISQNDFYFKIHSVMYSVVRDTILKGDSLDQVMVAQKIKSFGISFDDITDIDAYVENVCFVKPGPKATLEAADELRSLRIRRDIVESLDKANNIVSKSEGKSINEIIAAADQIYGEAILSQEMNKMPECILENLPEILIERADNPIEDIGFNTGFPEFDRLFGGLRPKNVYAICSRPAQGKTTWVVYLARRMAETHKIPTLVLDTEMSTIEQQFRIAASIADVPLWFLETGKWRNNPSYKDRVEKAFKQMRNPHFYHYEVGNRHIDEVISLIRRWHMTKVGRGNPCVIFYDYVKLTGEKVGQNWAEHQAIGLKIDKLKKITEELEAPLFTAMQLNRQGENQNRRGSDIVDDSSVISLSDRLQWFASFVAIFRRKTADEIAVDGEQFGTHKLVPTKTRFQGRDAAGHQDLVRRRVLEEGRNGPVVVDKWVNNFVNFSVQNFNVTERGSLRDVVNFENQQFDISQDEREDETAL